MGAQRGDVGEPAVHPLEPGDPGSGERPHRPGRDRVDPHPVRAEVGGEIADGRLEGGLGHAHHVVVGDDPLGPEVGQGDDRRSAPEQWSRLARECHQRVGGDVERQGEPVARRVEEAALEVLASRERQRVDEDVERVVRLGPACEHAGDLVVRAYVARLDEGRPDRLGQRPDALLDEALDRREADLGAFRVERLGDPPGDRVVVGDPEDERRLAVEQSHPVLQRVVARQPTIAR